jgi:hypothetical protein
MTLKTADVRYATGITKANKTHFHKQWIITGDRRLLILRNDFAKTEEHDERRSHARHPWSQLVLPQWMFRSLMNN